MRLALMLLWLPMAACVVPNAQAGASPHAERIAAAQAVYEARVAEYGSGRTKLEDVCAWSAHWHDAQKDAGDGAAGSAHLARMEALAAKVEQAAASGMATPRDVDAMRYFTAEAKVWQAR
ncbi:MAG: hypothetical protein ACI8PZ_006688 [Myxococcota bacterium]|jgi:hypothetical protein